MSTSRAISFDTTLTRPAPAAPPVRLLVAGALLGPLLVWLALALAYHPIGDPYTESDFYGAYCDGARAIARGIVDPSRYLIYGPGYEMLLAPFAKLGADLFLAARLLSVAAACGTLICWLILLAPALGEFGAALAAILAAATSTFTRYAYSATGDMPAAFLSSAAAATLLRSRGRGAAATAGALGALATLTRYQAAFLFVAGLVQPPLFERDTPGRVRAGRSLAFAGGFAAVLAPWLVFSLAHGVVPGGGLVNHYAFYASDDASRNVQDALAPADGGETPAANAARPAASTPALWARRALGHFATDARVLLGPGLALLALAGIAAWWRLGRGLDRVGTLGLLAAAALVPAFYSDRYRLFLIPIETAAIAALPAMLWPRRRVLAWAALALIAGLGVPLVAKNAAEQRDVHAQLPLDVLQLGPRLAGEPDVGQVLARKGHIGYYSGRRVIFFPRATTLAQLASTARAGNARFLYYSWYEARLRPEFVYLLDPSADVPGLEPIASVSAPAAVLYRIGPGFGADPDWLADDFARRVHEARGAVRAFTGAEAAPAHAVLAADALLHGRIDEARDLAREARAASPELELAERVENAVARIGAGAPPGIGTGLVVSAAADSALSHRAARRAVLPQRTSAPPRNSDARAGASPATDVRPGLDSRNRPL